MLSTSKSLLERIQNRHDPEAWQRWLTVYEIAMLELANFPYQGPMLQWHFVVLLSNASFDQAAQRKFVPIFYQMPRVLPSVTQPC